MTGSERTAVGGAPELARASATTGRSAHRARLVLVVAIAGVVAAIGVGAPFVVLLLVVVLAAVLVAAHPDLAGVVAVGLLYTNAVVIAVNHHGVPGAAAVLVPMLFLVPISFGVFARRRALLMPRAAVWVVALVVAQMIGAVSSRDPAASVATLQTVIIEGLLLFLLVTNAIRGFELVRLAAIVLVASAAVLGSLTAVKEVTDGGSMGGFATTSKAVVAKDQGGGAKRHAGPIGEQNRWAQSLAVLLPLAIALARFDRRAGVRVLAAVSTGGILVGLILTYSRGAVVGLALTGLVAVALRWVPLRAAVVVTVAVVIGLGAFAPVFAGRASSVVQAGSSVRGSDRPDAPVDGSIANRTTEAVAAFTVFSRHPVFGVGVGLFPTYFQEEARRQGADRIVGVNREAHSLYLGLAAESGVAGLVTFGGVIAALLGPLARVRRRHLARRPDVAALATGFALGVVTYLATGLFLHFAYIRYFWLLAGLAAAMGLVDELGREEPVASPVTAGAPGRR